MTKQILLVLYFTGNVFFGFGQKVNLSNFNLIQNNKQVLLYWTIESGPTCNGITIWRSIDSLNYNEIGSIGGICGSTSASISYTFTDADPIGDKTNYYKLRLGYSQFSDVRALKIKYIELGKLVIKPNPSSGLVVIEFNNDNKSAYELSITDNTGRKILARENITGSEIELNTTTWGLGTFYLTLRASGGKILKENLVIEK